ncbi:RHS repeat-associated core domain-containing protein [Chryseobacterium sp. CKR4-1]|uniref:RHS repeat-associated core domain-containing protein n=1 Tax=Chryseobacterium sp. CKR4-1 TaxID=3068896 RepID=UPI002796CB68|nr:RHS repeat-associated core domain-containing protein [Chryseobacterium sp. CKR4-1]MDQ1805055.1 RHS repeat-associated core domain-containing protein [Chryseobacterium sp. CKR4-1]
MKDLNTPASGVPARGMSMQQHNIAQFSEFEQEIVTQENLSFHDTRGTIEVSGNGQLQFTLPIALPPGIKSVAPQINLMYTSGSGNGIAGFGWNISGITSISRMGRNIDQDGENSKIQLDYFDYYMFMGQRLILKSGEYGKDGTEYMTEKYSNTKIRSIGENLQQNGPAYFEVTFEDGSQALYGSSADARTAIEYNIVRWWDAQGNYIDYNYIQGDNVAAIERIDWGGNLNAGTAHFNTIIFNYEQRQLRETSYLKGVHFVQNNLLSSIEVRANGNIFKTYGMKYEMDDHGNYYQFLKSITEFNSEGEAANPVIFDYRKSEQGEWKKASITNDKNAKLLYGDFDGDGKIDIIKYADAFQDCNHYESIYHEGNPTSGDDSQTGYWESYCTEPVDYPAGIYHFGSVFDDNKPKQVYVGSLITKTQLESAKVLNLKNEQGEILTRQGFFIYDTVPSTSSPREGRRDLVIKGYSLESDTANTKRLKEEFIRTVPADDYDSTVLWNNDQPGIDGYSMDTTIIEVKELDIDGDGVSELIFVLKDFFQWQERDSTEMKEQTTYRYLLVHPSESDPAKLSSIIGLYSFPDHFFAGTIFQGDFDGDGCVDFINFDSGGRVYLTKFIKNSSGSYSADRSLYYDNPLEGLLNKAIIADFTGDGKTDIMIPQAVDSWQWKLYINTGSGFRVQVLENFEWLKETPEFKGKTHLRSIDRKYFAQDLNKDGKADFIAFYSHILYDYSDRDVQTKFAMLYHENKGLDVHGNVIFELKNIDGSTLEARSSYKNDWYPIEYNEKWIKTQPLATNYVKYSKDETPVLAHFSPLIGDFRINNFNENILVFREGALLKYSHYSVAEEGLITSIHQGAIITEVKYEELDPDKNPGFYAPVNKEQYPYVELERLSGTFIVSQLIQEDRKQDFRYRGFVANVHGKGMLGFRKTARSSWYADGMENTKIWAGSEIDPRLEALPIKEWTVRTQGDDRLIFPLDLTADNNDLLSLKIINYNRLIPSAAVTAIVTASVLSKDFLKGILEETTFQYDQYYLPVKTLVKINGDFSVQTTDIEYIHNPEGQGSNYFIGRPVSKEAKLVAYGDEKRVREEYEYSSNLLLSLKKFNRDNSAWIRELYDHDSFGNVVGKTISNSTDANVQSDFAFYEPLGRFVIKKKDNLGLETLIGYNSWGQVLQQTDPFGNTIVNSYDAWGKLLSYTTNLEGTRTYEYVKLDDGGTKVTEIRADGTPKETYTDKLGQQYKVTTRGFNYEGYIASSGDIDYEVPDAVDTHISVETIYDQLGRKIGESEPFYDGAEKKWNMISYDDTVFPAIVTATAFTGKEMKTSVEGNTSIVQEVNGYGRTFKKISDALGNIVESEDAGGIIHFNFNAAGEQISTQYGDHVVRTGYDSWGRKSLLDDPSNGIYQYEYNGFGQPVKQISPKGFKEFRYNDKGQLIQQIEKSNVPGLTDKEINFTYNDKGLLEGRSGTSIGKPFSVEIIYDAKGRFIEQSEHSYGRIFFKKDIQYDMNSRIISYKKGLISKGKETSVEVAHSYDDWSGMLYKITDVRTGATLWKLKENDAMGNIIRANLGSSNIRNTFDAQGMLSETKQEVSGVPALNATYTFDSIRNELTEKTRSGSFSINENFLYDNNNRLIEWSNPKTNGRSSNLYDIRGRIVGNDNVGTVKFDNGEKIYQATGINFNDQGKLNYANDQIQQISYNENNDPLLIEGKEGDVRFEYGLDSMRQMATYGGKSNGNPQWEGDFTKYYSEDASCEVIYNKNTDFEKHILYIGGTPYESNIVSLKDYSQDSSSFIFLHKDHLGSILAVSNGSGDLIEESHFDAWGNLTHGSINILERGYTAHEHLAVVGTIHMNGRLYDPLLRRFLNPDNNIQDTFNSQNYNRYAYVLNNPLMYNDPSGEFFFGFLAVWGLSALWATVATGAIIGAAVGVTAYTVSLAVTGNLGMWNPGGALKATFFGAVSGATAAGIGSIFEATAKTFGNALLQAGAHGVSQGILGLVKGQNFLSSAAAGLLGSLGAYGWGKTMVATGLLRFARSTYGILSFGVLSGGIGAVLTRGNFWHGAIIGGVVAGLNHIMHQQRSIFRVYDGDGTYIGKISVLEYEKLSHGLRITLGFESASDKYTNYDWVQTVRTNDHIDNGFGNWVFNDPTGTAKDDNSPFYYTDEERMLINGRDGYTTIFYDAPARNVQPFDIHWKAELSLTGKMGNTTYEIMTFNYGFDLFKSGHVALYNLESVYYQNTYQWLKKRKWYENY